MILKYNISRLFYWEHFLWKFEELKMIVGLKDLQNIIQVDS